MKKLLTTLAILATPSLLLAQTPTDQNPAKKDTAKSGVVVKPSPTPSPAAQRSQAIEALNKTKTEVFYSQEFQNFLQVDKPSWERIQAEVEQKAKAQNPQANLNSQGPMQKLSAEELATYKLAFQNASNSKEIKGLRLAITNIQNSIQDIMETLTPGYKNIREKLGQ